MSSRIEDVAVALPSKILSNKELAEGFAGWTADKIVKKLGIEQRHVLAPEETPSDLAVSAAENLFNTRPEFRSEIDYLIFCTQSPDYLLPTSACIIQDRLGLPSTIGAIDINQGCSGYLHGLALAKSLVDANVAKTVLLLTADGYSKLVGDDDPSVRTIFGDAGTATIIARDETGESTLENFVFGSDGSGADKLIVKNSGMRTADGGAIEDLYMDGPAVLNFTLREIPPMFETLLQKADMAKADVEFAILHQANSFILKQLQRKLGLQDEQMIVDFADVGNTVSSTIPIALSRAIDKGHIERGQTGVLLGFGVGLSWAGCTIKF